ncbi:hypothetical protein [Corynebacterium tapiri]|uniref:Uncharacterized protein n=1 Tax=Corynebacterium tapiri TaxID=1448266 RepID=A0A5C4U2C9_9CORY|nr:hypothetical protein [Corynebacterium tapiri]TNL96092.1 hypothetical protein FHE74_08680 [Corynebacterium tapiri]
MNSAIRFGTAMGAVLVASAGLVACSGNDEKTAEASSTTAAPTTAATTTETSATSTTETTTSHPIPANVPQEYAAPDTQMPLGQLLRVGVKNHKDQVFDWAVAPTEIKTVSKADAEKHVGGPLAKGEGYDQLSEIKCVMIDAVYLGPADKATPADATVKEPDFKVYTSGYDFANELLPMSAGFLETACGIPEEDRIGDFHPEVGKTYKAAAVGFDTGANDGPTGAKFDGDEETIPSGPIVWSN